jgi:hypothetical protein
MRLPVSTRTHAGLDSGGRPRSLDVLRRNGRRPPTGPPVSRRARPAGSCRGPVAAQSRYAWPGSRPTTAFRAVEAMEVSQALASHDLGLERGALLSFLDRDDAELVGPASPGEHVPLDHGRGPHLGLNVTDRGACEQLHVVGDVEHSLAALLEVRVRPRGLEGPKGEPPEVRADARPHGRDVDGAVLATRRHDALDDHGASGRPRHAVSAGAGPRGPFASRRGSSRGGLQSG